MILMSINSGGKMTKKNLTEMLEENELIQKLIDSGYGEFIDKFLGNEGKVCTKKGK